MTASNQFQVQIVATTELQTVAAALAPGTFSAPLTVPSLGVKTPRLDPFNPDGQDWPDSCGGTATWGNSMSRAWIWASKAFWYAPMRAVVFTNSPHPFDEFGPPGPGNLISPGQYNAYLVLLTVFRELESDVIVYEAPFSAEADRTNPDVWPRAIGHAFDNQCLIGDTLYKITSPIWISGTGWVQPQITKIDLRKFRPDVPSMRAGAAYAGSIATPDNEITAGALDYLPGCNSFVHLHKSRLWFCDLATETWSAEIQLGFTTTNAFHNIGHYHPNTGKFVGGGGAYAGTNSYNAQFVAVDGTTKAITSLDPAPAAMSMSETRLVSPVPVGFREAKAAACYAPTSTESLFFHDDADNIGTVYALDVTRPAGSQWRTVGGWTGFEVDLVCPIPDYGVIVCFCYVVNGGSKIRLYKPPLLPDITPPNVPTGLVITQ